MQTIVFNLGRKGLQALRKGLKCAITYKIQDEKPYLTRRLRAKYYAELKELEIALNVLNLALEDETLGSEERNAWHINIDTPAQTV